MLGDFDTIAAIATAKGHGALSVVRISGTKTAEILKSCFVSKNFDSNVSHKVFYGFWKNPGVENSELFLNLSPQSSTYIDEVTVLNYSQGKGFTGEDAAEIICHGGPVVTDLVLEAALKAGARLARPGEFSYRAVVNGKMDLAQAESVLELISARSPRRAAQALGNIRGGFSRQIKEMDQELIYMLAHLEAAIDFTTEDIQPVDYSEISKKAVNLKNKIVTALEFFRENQKLQNGMRVVIAGRPNAGKSSLLNLLSGKDRSIVTEIAGTTRDVIESESLLDGKLVKFIDTAGIHESQDVIEKLGIEKTRQELFTADVIIYLIDANDGLNVDDVEQISKLPKQNLILCFNKMDLLETKKFPHEFSPKFSTDILDLSTYQINYISCTDESGMKELKNQISSALNKSSDSETEIFISTQRQEEALSKSLASLEKAIGLLNINESPDLISFEFRNSLINIKQVLGEDLNDEIMDKVFKEFCIGK